MTDEPSGGAPERSWLYNHVGRIAGMVLGIIVIAFVVFLAIVGFRPALYLLVLIVVGVLIISLGGNMRGTMRHR